MIRILTDKKLNEIIENAKDGQQWLADAEFSKERHNLLEHISKLERELKQYQDNIPYTVEIGRQNITRIQCFVTSFVDSEQCEGLAIESLKRELQYKFEQDLERRLPELIKYEIIKNKGEGIISIRGELNVCE